MAHKIFANDEGEADIIASMFEGEGYEVRMSRVRPGAFVELEVAESPAGHAAPRWR